MRRAPAGVGLVQVRARRDDRVDRVEHVGRQLDVDRAELALELLEGARADDRGRHGGMPDDEGERQVDEAEPGLLGELGELLDGVELLLVARDREVVAGRDPRRPGGS